MSGLELEYFRRFDMKENVLKWASEEVIVPYKKPIFEDSTGRILKFETRKYITDVWLLIKRPSGELVEIVAEIKPLSQVEKPKEPLRKTKKSMKNYINACCIWQINMMKWKSALEAIERLRKQGRNIYFQILTENKIIEFNNGQIQS